MIEIVLKYRRLLIIGVQTILVVLANCLAFWLRFDGVVPKSYRALWIQMLPWLVVIRGLTFIPCRLYEGLWHYTGMGNLCNILP